MKRSIQVFDKKTEEYSCSIDIAIPAEKILNYYKDMLIEDPMLIYEYEIKKADIEFYKRYVTIDFEFDKFDYFLSCSVS